MAAFSEEALIGELKARKVKLWLPPYSEDGEGVLRELAASVALTFDASSEEVERAILVVRSRTMEKLLKKRTITMDLVVRGVTAATLAVDKTDHGETVRAKIIASLTTSTSTCRCVAGGRTLRDGSSLEAQGWVVDADRPESIRALVWLFDGQLTGRDEVLALRSAAERLAEDGAFQLSDASTGSHVRVNRTAQRELVSAVALYARGRELLDVPPNDDDAGAAGRQAKEAIAYLCEADAAFERCRSLAPTLLDQIDNQAMLQLDMCRAYVMARDVGSVGDAERRLSVARVALEKRHSAEFLRLALTAARQGRTLPPALVSVARCWLLEGLAMQCRDESSSLAKLQEAALLVRGLCVDSRTLGELVQLGATERQARAALRRAEGDVQKAATAFLDKKRTAKTIHIGDGATEDGSYIDAKKLDMLIQRVPGKTLEVYTEAMKRSNNDLESAASSLGEGSQEAVQPVKRRKRRVTVDEGKVAALVAIGADRRRALKALRATDGNVDAAALRLISHDDDGDDDDSGGDDDEPEEEPEDAELQTARELVERQLGGSLRRKDLEDELDGCDLRFEAQLLEACGL